MNGQFDIDQWLTNMGLAEYCSAFAENNIDFQILRELTAEDLQSIGVRSVGHRRKLLSAISGLANGSVQELTGSAKRSIPVQAAERRQLTVMFVDLVGSTSLSSLLDPEDMQTLLTAYQNAVAGAVTRFEGNVAKYMGDGVLCYFGYPNAHEDDAERAVRAALAILAALKGLETPRGEPVLARIGIATGLVVVGDLIGAGAAQEEAVVGETPNLAARLQASAEPGQIVIGPSTRRLIGDAFSLTDLGLRPLKGIAQPARLFAVIGIRASQTRFEAKNSGTVAPLIGREQELALMLERWDRAKSGEGQVIVLTGEAGIGKSRLMRAMNDAVAREVHTRVSYQCSPYHSDSPFYPVIQQLTFAAGITPDDTDDVKFARLDRLLIGEETDKSLIAALLGLDPQGRYGSLNLTPQQQRLRTLEALAKQLTGLAKSRPIFWVIEDAHWIDPTTLELIDICLERISRARVNILITARPTFQHGFGGHPIVTKLALNKLGRDQVSKIVQRITNGKSLPDELLELIAEKTDGVPLFVEEMTKTVLESDILTQSEGGYELTGPLNQLTIPVTLYDSLMARLDRLQPVKEVAQTAACIGRDFEYGLLREILSLSEPALQDALERLTAAELIFRRGIPPDASYVFKHALVRDAAYENLLRRQRQSVHQRLHAALTRREAAPEVLAQHAALSGRHEIAIDHWLEAGQRASLQSADQEAVRHLERALGLLPSITDADARDRKEIAIRVALGGPLIATRGYAFAETAENFARARELCDRVGDRERLLPVLYGEYAAHYVYGDLGKMRSTAKRFEELAERGEPDGIGLIVKRFAALDAFHTGQPVLARRLLNEALAAYEPNRHIVLANQFGHDAKVSSLSYLSWVLWTLGAYADVETTSEAALDWSRSVTHANSKGVGLCWGGAMTRALLGDYHTCLARARESLEFSNNMGLPLWRAYGRILAGHATSCIEPSQTARDEILAGLAMLEHTGNRRNVPLLLAWAAEAELSIGATDRGRTLDNESV